MADIYRLGQEVADAARAVPIATGRGAWCQQILFPQRTQRFRIELRDEYSR